VSVCSKWPVNCCARPEVRRGYLCERLAHAEQLAAERAEARAKAEAARDNNKVEWHTAVPDFDD
jgi:hypothetical protein